MSYFLSQFPVMFFGICNVLFYLGSAFGLVQLIVLILCTFSRRFRKRFLDWFHVSFEIWEFDYWKFVKHYDLPQK